jgi:transposase
VEGIGSAREVARLCDEHIAFEWLCGGVGMNAKTLADFRVESNLPANPEARELVH